MRVVDDMALRRGSGRERRTLVLCAGFSDFSEMSSVFCGKRTHMGFDFGSIFRGIVQNTISASPIDEMALSHCGHVLFSVDDDGRSGISTKGIEEGALVNGQRNLVIIMNVA